MSRPPGVPAHSVDKGWAWIILLASFLINILSLGVFFSSGIYLVVFLEELHENIAAVAWIPAISSAVSLIPGPLIGMLVDKFGFRVILIIGSLICFAGFIASSFAHDVYILYGTFGVLIGFGCGLCYLPGITMVRYYFDTKKYFAMALSSVGSGLTSFIFPPFLYYLIETYGLRGALLLNAGISLNMIVCGCVSRPIKLVRKNDSNPKEPIFFHPDLLKDVYFYISVAHIYFLNGYYIFIVLFNKFVTEKGIGIEESSYLTAMFGFGNLIGRILVSILGLSSKFSNMVKYFLVNIVTFVQGLAFVLLTLPRSFNAFASIAAIAGFTYGIKAALILPLNFELFNLKYVNSVFGATLFGSGLAILTGPYFAGWITYLTGNIDSGMILAGCYVFISGIFTILITCELHRRTSMAEKTYVNNVHEEMPLSSEKV